jgi:hypothetical protein
MADTEIKKEIREMEDRLFERLSLNELGRNLRAMNYAPKIWEDSSRLRFGMSAADIEEYKRKEKERENPVLIH